MAFLDLLAVPLQILTQYYLAVFRVNLVIWSSLPLVGSRAEFSVGVTDFDSDLFSISRVAPDVPGSSGRPGSILFYLID